MGSKSKIAPRIIGLLPRAENFYDLFGGGFSITHAALLSKKWKYFYFNEIESDVCKLIQDAIAGKYSYKNFKPKFITREEFEKNKNDPYVRVCWSFGNNQKDYLFGRQIEDYKRSMHNAVVFDEFDSEAKKVFGFDKWNGESILERRLILRNVVKSDTGDVERLQQLQQLQRLEQLEQLQRLERLEQLQRLEFSSVDYRDVQVKSNSIIYCDPPYANTVSYLATFKSFEFYDWVESHQSPVYFSEYSFPKMEGIYILGLNKKKSLLNPNKKWLIKDEMIYTNKIGLEYFNDTFKND